MQKYLVIDKWKFIYTHTYTKYHNEPVINPIWPTDNSFIHLIFIEYLLRGRFVQGYTAGYLACSRIQAKERILRNEVKANRVWKKGRSWTALQAIWGVFPRFWTKEKQFDCGYKSPRNVLWETFQGICSKWEKFPLNLINALFITYQSKPCLLLFLNYLIHTLRGTFQVKYPRICWFAQTYMYHIDCFSTSFLIYSNELFSTGSLSSPCLLWPLFPKSFPSLTVERVTTSLYFIFRSIEDTSVTYLRMSQCL